MAMRKKHRLLGLFFCVAGSVYAGPAIGAEGDEPAAPATQESAPALFEAGPTEGDALPQGQAVEVGSFGQIDLHVKDLELTKVLQLLSLQSQRNIVASRNVAGTVSADLYGVDFYEALDAVLHTNGFDYVEKGNFIYVYTADELRALKEAQRKTVSQIIRLNYITAADASAFVSPLLSDAGSISVSGDSPTGFLPSVSDGGSNSFAHADTLIIRDYPENVEQITGLLQELDQRPKQVLVEATILQAGLTEKNALGVDFAIFTDLDIEDFTTPLGAVDDLIAGEGAAGTKFNSGQSITTSPGNVANGESSIKIGFLGSDAAVFIRALDSVTDTTVLATPKVLVLNRQRADLLVGERLGYLSTTATDVTSTQTVEFLDVGTQLTLRPFVSNDGFVRLELRPQISDGVTRTVGDFVIPDETTQELQTNVMVRSGQTVVLGGLFKEDTTIDRRQVPGAGDIPLLGTAFKGQDDTVDRSEVIFLIKPTVLKDQALYAAGERASDNIEKAALGARRGLLPWSRTKLTNSHIKQAYEHMAQGEKDKALWDVNLALYLDPGSVDGLRLKEQLTGERFYLQDRGVLNDAIDQMIDAEYDFSQEKNIVQVKPAEAEGDKALEIDIDVAPETEAVSEPETSVNEAAEEPAAEPVTK